MLVTTDFSCHAGVLLSAVEIRDEVIIWFDNGSSVVVSELVDAAVERGVILGVVEAEVVMAKAEVVVCFEIWKEEIFQNIVVLPLGSKDFDDLARIVVLQLENPTDELVVMLVGPGVLVVVAVEVLGLGPRSHLTTAGSSSMFLYSVTESESERIN